MRPLIIEAADNAADIVREGGAAGGGVARKLGGAVEAGEPRAPARLVGVGIALNTGSSASRFFARAYASGSPEKATPLTSTVSPLRQNAPWSIMIEVNVPTAPNAVCWLPLTPSPESILSAAGSWLGSRVKKAGKVPPPLLNELSSAAATAAWLPLRPAIWPMPELSSGSRRSTCS